MNRLDALLKIAVDHGFDENKAIAALEASDINAIRELFDSMEAWENKFYFHLTNKYVEAIFGSARQKGVENLIKIGEFFSEKGFDSALNWVIAAIAQTNDKRGLLFLRNILEVGSGFSEHAAQAIVALEYDRSAQLALHDDSELVRYVAVRQLEKQEHSSILIESLKSTSFRVRQIAAWYMGRKLVKEAVMPLIELSQVETDEETLRAVVWSLGVLRDKRAIPYLHLLRHHKSSLIASSVETALANFSK